MNSLNENEILSKIHKDLSSGLLYTHTASTPTQPKPLKQPFLYALIEILNEKGLLSIEELDERKKQIAAPCEEIRGKRHRASVADPEYDKYIFEHEVDVDCQSKLPSCKAICCKFPFALSKQDMEEGIIRWKFGKP